MFAQAVPLWAAIVAFEQVKLATLIRTSGKSDCECSFSIANVSDAWETRPTSTAHLVFVVELRTTQQSQ